MLRKILFTIIILFAGIKLISQTCEAWFYSAPDSLNQNKYYFFDSSSPQSQIISWNWNFGDGFSSTLTNPVHTFSNSGSFIVSLSITTSNCADTISMTIEVGNTVTSCEADFLYFYDSLNTNKVFFYGNFQTDSLSNVQWNWDFGDGTNSNIQNPVHTYAIDSAYNVSMIASGTECTVNVNKTIPVGSFAYNDDCLAMFSHSALDPNSLVFQFYNESWSNDSIFNVFWDFGDGSTSQELNPMHDFQVEGQYEVTLTLTSQNCTSSIIKTIYAGENTWYPSDCQAMFYFEQDNLNYLQFHFFDASFYTGQNNFWYWNFGDGEVSYFQNPVHTFTNEGVYNVSLDIYSDSCLSSIQMQLIISQDSVYTQGLLAMFYPEFLDENTVYFHNLSLGDITDFYWDFGDGTYSMAAGPTHDFDEVGIHEIALSVRNLTDSNTTLITINFDNQQLMYANCFPGGNFAKTKEINNSGFVLYPNPFNEFVVILNEKQEKCIVEISNSLGQVVFKTKLENDQYLFDLSDLPAGVYFVKIISPENIYKTTIIKK